MILYNKQSMVAFRCANCGSIVKSVKGVFFIPGEKKVIKCDCGNKLDIVNTGDNKLRFTLRCRFCGMNHQYNVNQSTIFKNESLVMSCDVTGFDILFIGSPGEVYKAVEESEEYIDEWAQAGNEQDYSDNDYPENGDSVLADGVVLALKELALEGKIICNCKKEDRRFVVDRYSDNIVIRCKTCGCEKRIETHEGSLDAYNVIDCDKLYLNK